MKIFELLAPQPTEADQEDDSQGKFDANKVDQNLQDVANGVNYQQAQPEPQVPQQDTPPELDDKNTKPIDNALMAQIKSLPYGKKYKFKDNDPMNPINFAQKSIEELNGDLRKVRYKIQLLDMQDQVGTDDDKTMEFCIDLRRLISTVLQFKKTNTSAQLAATNSAPPFQTIAR